MTGPAQIPDWIIPLVGRLTLETEAARYAIESLQAEVNDLRARLALHEEPAHEADVLAEEARAMAANGHG